MNQIRNLWIIILSNIVVISLISYVMAELTKGKSLALTIAQTLVVICIMVALNLILSAFIFMTDSTDDIVYLVPPASFFILLYILVNHIMGNIKLIRSMDYTYFGRYRNKKIYVYNFTPYCMHRLDYFIYNGPEDIGSLKSSLLETHNSLNKIPCATKNSFVQWDGTVDEESKRIRTIDKIIK